LIDFFKNLEKKLTFKKHKMKQKKLI